MFCYKVSYVDGGKRIDGLRKVGYCPIIAPWALGPAAMAGSIVLS